jgi:hypothetical protein
MPAALPARAPLDARCVRCILPSVIAKKLQDAFARRAGRSACPRAVAAACLLLGSLTPSQLRLDRVEDRSVCMKQPNALPAVAR